MTTTNEANSGTIPAIKASDVATACSLLTRFPLRDAWVDSGRLSVCPWAFPIVGLLIGLCAGLLSSFLIWCGVPVAVSIVLAIGLSVLLTGGLHEDGLADCSDGLGGGHTKEKCLEIMKDSRIGAYGVIALILVFALEWSALGEIPLQHLMAAFIVAGAVSRTPMVAVMAFMPPARTGGLSHYVGRPRGVHVATSVAISALIALICFGGEGVTVLFFGLIASLPLLLLAQKKIQGQTGDVLGATQKISEAAVLIVLASILA